MSELTVSIPQEIVLQIDEENAVVVTKDNESEIIIAVGQDKNGATEICSFDYSGEKIDGVALNKKDIVALIKLFDSKGNLKK